MAFSNLIKELTPILLAAVIMFIGGCVPEGEEDSADQSATTSVSTKVIYAQIDPAMDEGGIAAVFTDVEQEESLGIEVIGDGNGAITRINRYYLTNHETGNSVSMQLDENGLPISITYSDGYELQFSNLSAQSVDITIYDDTGVQVAGPHTYQGDLSEIVNAGSSLSTHSLKTSQKVNWAGICDYITCDKMYFVASKGLDILGCAGANAAAVATGGLTVPLAYAICGSTLISIASEVAKEATDSNLFEATGLISDNLATAGSCIYSLVNPLGQAADCIKGVGEQVYWIYDKATSGNEAINVSTLFPNNCLTGSWSGNLGCAGANQPDFSQPAVIQIIQDGNFISFPNQPSQTVPNGAVIDLPSVANLNDGRWLSLTGSVSTEQPGFKSKTTLTQTYNFESCSSVLSNAKIQISGFVDGQSVPGQFINCFGTLTK